MSAPSVKLILRTDKVRSDGTAPVVVRITAHRKTRQKSTGIYVEPRLWNPKRQEVRSSHDIADALNAKLRATLNEARTLALDTSTAQTVQARLGGEKGSFTAYFQEYIDRLDAQGKFWQWKKYRSALAKLRACLGNDLGWKEMDRDALVRFERYLREERGHNPNTLRKELSRVSRVYKEAVRDGVIEAAANPFLVYRKPKGQRVERRKLSSDEMASIEVLDANGGLTPGTFDEVARDAFVFSYYAAGMRFGDIAKLKASEIQDRRVSYRMLKTGTPIDVPLPDRALRIVKRYSPTAATRGGYLFPFLVAGDERDGVHLRRRINSKNAQANTALKRIANKAGVDDAGLSFHLSRHSFADYARRRGGQLYAISKALGHTQLHITETYLKSFDRDAVDDLAATVWG